MNTPNEPKPLGAEEIEKLLARFEPGWKSFMKFVDHFFGNKGAKPWVSIPAREDNDDLFVTALLRDAESAIRALTAENATLQKQRDMMSAMLNGKTFTVVELKEAGLGEGVQIEQNHAVYRLQKENATLRAERIRTQGVIEHMERLHLYCFDRGCTCGDDPDGVCAHCNKSTRLSELAAKEFDREQTAIEADRDRIKARVEELEAERQRLLGNIVEWKTGFVNDKAQLAAANQQNTELRAQLNEVMALVEKEVYMPQGEQADIGKVWSLLESFRKAALAQAGYPICVNCGVGFILPSGVCDHCDTKQAGGKAGA